MATANHVEQARREGVLLGIPLGDLGWFQSLLMGVAAGFAAFFATTFAAIMVLLVLTAMGRSVDFAVTYRWFGFPVGVLVMALSLGFLGVQWSRRMARKGRRA